MIEEQLIEEKVKQLRHVLKLFGWLLFPCSAVIASNLALGVVRGYTWQQDILHVILQGVTMITMFRPDLLTAKTMDLFYGILMVCFCLVITPFTCNEELATVMLFVTNVLVILLTAVRRTVSKTETPFMLFFNCTFVVCSSSTLWVHGAPCFGGKLGLVRHLMVACQALLIFIMTWAAGLMEDSFATILCNNLEAQESKELYGAACALLRSCCEVVVELDSDGVILSPAMDLSRLLVKGSTSSLQGSRLADLITDTVDRETFRRRLRASNVKEMGLAETMHVRTKNGDNALLHLELLWFQFGRLREVHYMCGLREFSDAAAERHAQVGLRSRRSRRAVPVDAGSAAGNESGTGGPSCSGSSSSGSDSSPPSATCGLPVAVVDVAVPGLPILKTTAPFVSQIGTPSAGVGMMELVAGPKEFEVWLQTALSDMKRGLNPRDYKLTLQMPQGQVRASCRVLPCQTSALVKEDRATTGDFGHVRLVFLDVRRSHVHFRDTPEHLSEAPIRSILKSRGSSPSPNRLRL